MQHLYAPWRDQYIKETKPKGCVFCHIVNNPDEDEENGVLFRGENYFIVINRYPYTPGHFMVIPNQHIKSLLQLDMKVWMQISEAVKKSVEVLHQCLNPKGINLGMNIGAEAGAGIANTYTTMSCQDGIEIQILLQLLVALGSIQLILTLSISD